MQLRELISADKLNVSVQTWTSEKPKKKDFPLSCVKGGGAFPLTRKWRWTVVEFEVRSRLFRIIVAYHQELPEFRAALGEAVGNDTRVLARLEYHANHAQPGWHMHVNCEEPSQISLGVVKPLGQTRIPSTHHRHRRMDYTPKDAMMSDNMALGVAATWFRFRYQPSLAV